MTFEHSSRGQKVPFRLIKSSVFDNRLHTTLKCAREKKIRFKRTAFIDHFEIEYF